MALLNVPIIDIASEPRQVIGTASSRWPADSIGPARIAGSDGHLSRVYPIGMRVENVGSKRCPRVIT